MHRDTAVVYCTSLILQCYRLPVHSCFHLSVFLDLHAVCLLRNPEWVSFSSSCLVCLLYISCIHGIFWLRGTQVYRTLICFGKPMKQVQKLFFTLIMVNTIKFLMLVWWYFMLLNKTLYIWIYMYYILLFTFKIVCFFKLTRWMSHSWLVILEYIILHNLSHGSIRCPIHEWTLLCAGPVPPVTPGADLGSREFTI